MALPQASSEAAIERAAERIMDSLDRRLMRGDMSQAEYDSDCRCLDEEVERAIGALVRQPVASDWSHVPAGLWCDGDDICTCGQPTPGCPHYATTPTIVECEWFAPPDVCAVEAPDPVVETDLMLAARRLLAAWDDPNSGRVVAAIEALRRAVT